MRRFLMPILALTAMANLAACSPAAQQKIDSAVQTAAPTIQAAAQSARTEVSAAIGTAGPTFEAAAKAAGTEVAAAIGTAGPTVQAAANAAGTGVAGAIGTAGPTLAAAGQALGFVAATGTTWAWQGTTMKDYNNQTPTDPAKYTVKFNQDSTVDIQADCNSAAGSYKLEGTALTITVGPMTMAACPAGSLSDTFVQQLGQVAGYATEGGALSLTLKDMVGSMSFEAVK
jgi:heat shock protein HslJ